MSGPRATRGALEHKALVLRQTAGLMRHGATGDDALRVAMEGLPAGTLREDAERVLSDLAAGRIPDRRGALSCVCASVDEVERAAMAVEARLVAESAVRTARLVLTLATAGPLLVVSLWAWILQEYPAVQGASFEVLLTDVNVASGSIVLVAVGLVAPVLAVGAVLGFGRLGLAFAPGARQSLKAAAVLEATTSGDGSAPRIDPAMLSPAEWEYAQARQSRVGAEQTAVELAEEWRAESVSALLWFRTLAPIVGAGLVFPFVIAALGVLAWPLFMEMRAVGLPS